VIPVSCIRIPELDDLEYDTIARPSHGPSARDYERERRAADVAFINDLAIIREKAEGGGIVDDKWMYLVKALLACPLPYRPTSKRQITRRTRFDGRWVSITYTACRPNIAMPYGADAKLMHWLFDRGLRQARDAEKSGAGENRVVSYRSTNEYLVDCGMCRSSANYQTVSAGFRRLTGLAITIEVEIDDQETGAIIPLLDGWRLPKSIDHNAARLTTLSSTGYGFTLSKELYEHGRKHCVRIPRQMWRLLKGRPRKAAILLWVYVRAWAAESESKVTWEVLREQLWYDESNPRKLPGQANDAINRLRLMWPGANIECHKDGIVFRKARSYLIPVDQAKNRYRFGR
jgi:hypothetical protein